MGIETKFMFETPINYIQKIFGQKITMLRMMRMPLFFNRPLLTIKYWQAKHNAQFPILLAIINEKWKQWVMYISITNIVSYLLKLMTPSIRYVCNVDPNFFQAMWFLVFLLMNSRMCTYVPSKKWALLEGLEPNCNLIRKVRQVMNLSQCLSDIWVMIGWSTWLNLTIINDCYELSTCELF